MHGMSPDSPDPADRAPDLSTPEPLAHPDPASPHQPVYEVEPDPAHPLHREREAEPDPARPAGPSLADALGLVPHPEGGWYRQTWVCAHRLRPDGYPSDRSAANLIYFLLKPGEEAGWHTVRSDELWLHHRGSSIVLRSGGTGAAPTGDPSTLRLGSDVAAGERPQALVPGGTWQSARNDGTSEALMSCLVSPGFDPDDLTLLES